MNNTHYRILQHYKIKLNHVPIYLFDIINIKINIFALAELPNDISIFADVLIE